MVEYFRIVWSNLKNRKLRSFLTILGIIIGVSAIVLLYSFAQSMQDVVGDQFDKLGSNRVIISPKGFSPANGGVSGSFGLNDDDAKTISKVKGVDYVARMLVVNMAAKYGGVEEVVSVTAVSTDYIEKMFKSFSWDLQSGRIIKTNENTPVVVVGAKVGKEIFDKELYVKSSIKLDGRSFRIIGVLEEVGNIKDDYRILMPLDQARDLKDIRDGVTGITATVLEGVDLDKISTSIEKKLKRKKDSENFEVTTPAQLKEKSKNVIGVVKQVIVAIALIALLIGGLGIMNSMYTAVLERTREIGVMKAIGARNNDILSIFIIEASTLGGFGGAIGAAFSVILIALANIAISQSGVLPITVKIDPIIVLAAIAFSVGIGIVSGMSPAIRASKLQPVDALRYE